MRHRVVVLVAFVLVLAGAESVARWVEPRVPAEGAWRPTQAGQKATQMERFVRAHGRADVVFVGSSIGAAAFDPLQVQARRGRGHSYNASVGGMSMRSCAAWTDDVVIPVLRPKVLVIALSVRDLNDEGIDQAWALRSYLESPGRRRFVDDRDALHRASDAVREHVALVRTRHVWRLAANNLASFIDLLNAPTPPVVVPFGHQGEALGTGFRSFRQDPSGDKHLAESVFNDYRVGGVERSAVEHMVAAIRRIGGSAVLVATPYDEPSVLKVLAGGRPAIRRYEHIVEDLAADLDVPLVDGQPTLGSRTMLYDIHHLNAGGRARLTDMVAAVLEEPR